VEVEILGPEAARGEAVFLALRTREGLDPAAFASEFGAAPRHFFPAAIDELGAQGLLDEAGDGGLRLTARGRMLSDSVFERFV
jgi:coproporphyrinogen III oxidase-like Fe-S oxidoreductase